MNASATSVRFAKGMMRVHLSDRRVIGVPLAWFPRLRSATAAQRSRWRLIGKGIGIHWSDIDEDVSVAALLDPKRELYEKRARLSSCCPRRRPGSSRRP